MAVSLVSADEQKLLRPIERLLGRQIPIEVVDGFEQNPADKDEETFVDFRRSGRGQKTRGFSRSRSEGANRRSNGSTNRTTHASR